MPRKGANISLSSYDDIFETDESRADSQLEKVQKIPISELVPFKNHPFKVVDDEAMLRTTESIAQFGVLTPLIARPLEDGLIHIKWNEKPLCSVDRDGIVRFRPADIMGAEVDRQLRTVTQTISQKHRRNPAKRLRR